MQEQIGVVTVTHGQAYAEGANGLREVSEGAPIYCNEVIKTGDKGSVEIEFIDGALLSLGARSTVSLDEYIFDPDQEIGEFAVELLKGAMRSVTGEIVDINPEGFSINTELSTIGIRGTTTGHVVSPTGEETHIVIDFVDKPVVISSKVTGEIRVISQDGLKVVSSAEGISSVTEAKPSEVWNLEKLSSSFVEGDDDMMDGGEDSHESPAADGPGDMMPGEAEGVLHLVMPEPGGMPFDLGADPLFGGPLMAMQSSLDLLHLDMRSADEILEDSAVSTSSNTLDLSSSTTAMTVRLDVATPYLEETGDSDTREDVSDDYTNVFGSSSGDYLVGNDEANILSGAGGADILLGLVGNDVLTGGEGADTFHYVSLIDGGDTIVDFSTSEDVLEFNLSGFSGDGDLVPGINTDSFKEISDASYLVDGQSSIDADDHFVYYDDGETYQLYYDANGNEAGGQTLIASFTNDADLTANDIQMV